MKVSTLCRTDPHASDSIVRQSTRPSPTRLMIPAVLFMVLFPCLATAAGSVPKQYADIAFALSKRPFIRPRAARLSTFDLPQEPGENTIGLDFNEADVITSMPANALDNGVWWIKLRPRAGVERFPLEVYISRPDEIPPQYQKWGYANFKFDYSSSLIKPELPKTIPVAARYLAALDVGHRENAASWPQWLHLGSNGYYRLAPDGMVFGSSLRIGVIDVGERREQFPVIRRVYVRPLNDRNFELDLIVDSTAFTAAIHVNLRPGKVLTAQVDSIYFVRGAFKPDAHGTFGPLGISSMHWKNHSDTPENSNDAAHDSDRFLFCDKNSRVRSVALVPPTAPGESQVKRFGRARCFTLKQTDRDPTHFSAYSSAEYADRPSIAISNIKSSAPYEIRLLSAGTAYEGADNIAAFATWTIVPKVPRSIEEGILFSYAIKASK